ncbi:MAG: transposase [Aquincola sp.]|nr:transposase [Aquincola sp.]MDH4287602.1 transposase [Aquincola sp.]MDH5330603.1 transposase [Aquincola sp.]
MARLPRLVVAGELHRVLLRGHAAQAVLEDPVDRDALVEALRQALPGSGVALHAYALMRNEAHLLVTPAQRDALGRLMQAVGRRFGSAHNRRCGRRGALWEGRFRCGVIEAETYLIEATVLIESLPVQAGWVAQAADWRWSSASHHLGRFRDPLVSEHTAYWNIGNTPFERERAHADLISRGVAPEVAMQLEAVVMRSHALGGEAFLRRIGQAIDRPIGPGRRGRPPKAPEKP